MASSNLYINWVNFIWTPDTGSPIVVDKITNCSVTRDGTPIEFKGDDATYTEAVAVVDNKRGLSIDFGNVAQAALIPFNVQGTAAVTLADSKGGVTSGQGALRFTLHPCVAVTNPVSGAHAAWASSTVTFMGYDPTNSHVDPLTIVPL